MRGFGIFAAVLFCAAPPRADDIELNCDHPVAMMEQDLCASREYEAADAALNAAYARAQRGLGARRRALLIDAQRAWVAFRDKQCNYVLVVSEGSGRNVAYAGCLSGLTRARTQDLGGIALR